jgi:hypothetical protein
MKDPALAVLQEHLPNEIRPLAISLLTSEQDGMKQFEHAIQKIASDVQSLDRTSTQRAIRHLEETIDALHGKLSTIDHKIDEWAKRNLAKIELEGEKIEPMDAAREVIDSVGRSNGSRTTWVSDPNLRHNSPTRTSFGCVKHAGRSAKTSTILTPLCLSSSSFPSQKRCSRSIRIFPNLRS